MFILFSLLSVIRALGPPKSRGVDPKEVKPTSTGFLALTIWLIAGGGLALTLVMGPQNGILTSLILLLSALILVGMFLPTEKQRKVSRELHRMPGIPGPEARAQAASQYRARASQLTATALLDPPATTAPESPPGAPVPRQRTITTFRQLREDAELDERMLRVAAIIITPCPACQASEAQLCTPVDDEQEPEPLYLLDRDRGIVAHGKRIGSAVKAGNAKITDVVAQFDNRVPDDVWAAILDED